MFILVRLGSKNRKGVFTQEIDEVETIQLED